jgi:polyphenol oxidase
MQIKDFDYIYYVTSHLSNGNMDFPYGDAINVLNNRSQFLSSHNIPMERCIALKQIHSDIILTLDEKDIGTGMNPQGRFVEADGMITNQPNIFLFMLVADCIALALFDPKKNVIGMIHGGRIGLDKKIFTHAIHLMQIRYGCDPKDIIAQISPSIGPCCYFLDYPYNSGENMKSYAKHINDEKFSLNIWQAAMDQLLEAGLIEDNITNPQSCTFHSGAYFSHRKSEQENEPEGRFAVVIGMQK